MLILDCTLRTYTDAHGGGTLYPDLGQAVILDWIERGPRLVVVLDLTEEEAQAVILANPAYAPRIVTRAEVDAYMWSATRERRDREIAGVEWMVSRHAQERDLVAANKQPATALAEAKYLELLQYIQALRDVPNAAEYPRQVTWPVRPEGL